MEEFEMLYDEERLVMVTTSRYDMKVLAYAAELVRTQRHENILPNLLTPVNSHQQLVSSMHVTMLIGISNLKMFSSRSKDTFV